MGFDFREGGFEMNINSGETSDTSFSQGEWRLIWSDEFTGSEIDRSKWTLVGGGDGFGNNELQFYTARKENAYLENEKLMIRALKETYEDKVYTSAKLMTRGKAEWTYGRFEIRAKSPKGQGIWPAIWMMPADMVTYGEWPSCGEIDIMELIGSSPNTVHGTLHYGHPHTYTGQSYTLSNGDFSEDYHIFALEWTPTEMRWFVDDQLYSKQSTWFSSPEKGKEQEPFPAPFNRPFYLQLNLAVGGNWPGNPDPTTVFPQTFEIDYVRVYEFISDF